MKEIILRNNRLYIFSIVKAAKTEIQKLIYGQLYVINFIRIIFINIVIAAYRCLVPMKFYKFPRHL